MKKALFLDRDGVINKEKNYLYKIEDFEFIDGVFETCRYFHELGYLIVIITNQAGIARKKYTEEDFLASIDGGSKAFKVFKRRAYEEYKTLKFPAWKRVPLNKFSLKRPIPDANFELMGPKIYKRFFEMDESEEILAHSLDFQGSDRKFTLLADSFSTDGIIVRTEKAANYAETLICKFTSESQLASNLIIVEGAITKKMAEFV